MPAPAYKTLQDGRIVWVYPGEAVAAPAQRSRMGTDAEVRARIAAEVRRRRIAGEPYFWAPPPVDPATARGGVLDTLLRQLGLPARQQVDEPA